MHSPISLFLTCIFLLDFQLSFISPSILLYYLYSSHSFSTSTICKVYSSRTPHFHILAVTFFSLHTTIYFHLSSSLPYLQPPPHLPSLLTISPSHSVTSSLLLYPSLLRFSLIFFFTPIFFYIYLYQISIPHFQSIPMHLLSVLTPLIQLPSLFLFIISTA